MQYRDNKTGEKISLLGYGCMRFTKKGNSIDLDKAEKEIKCAIDGGVNYFDTAYVYPGNEVALGEILSRLGCRKQVQIATKLPHYLIRSLDGVEKMFQEELKRLQTDYVDYYLMHMLTDTATWDKMKKLGIEQWISEKKASGQIRHIGFSYHGNTEMFCKLIDAYDWDFTQIQYNYMDEHTQAGRKGLQYAARKGIPVIIMEPLRGGRLVQLLPESAKKIIAENEKHRSPAEWAFRWLYNQPEITCVLSGMNSMEMVEDNIRTAASAQVGDLGDAEQQMLRQVVAAINANMKVGCTGCGYCMPCPKGVDIPGTFADYNRIGSEGKTSAFREHMMGTALRKNQSGACNCIGCGKCEQHCPQGIAIRQELKNAGKELEGPLYRLIAKIVKTFRIFG